METLIQPACILIDNSFGPWAGQCRGGFDFTLLFEEVILAAPLLSVFLLVSPFRLNQLRMESVKTIASPLKIYKTVCWPRALVLGPDPNLFNWCRLQQYAGPSLN